MTIITISRGTYSQGKLVAEKVAEKLGYKIVGRNVLLEASDEYNIPEIKLTRALHDSPTIFDRFVFGKEKYVVYIRQSLLQRLKGDNVVYHGLAGHFFLQDIPHVMKVRIIADLEYRVKEEMKREGITEKEARYLLAKDDAERRKWGLYLYNVDTWDPLLYDLVIHIGKLTPDNAADLIVSASQVTAYQSTPASQQIFDQKLFAAQVQALLIEKCPSVDVDWREGTLHISCKGSLAQRSIQKDQVSELLSGMPGTENYQFEISPS